MTAKEFFNIEYPDLVKNWSHQASLLSYDQVLSLMENFHEEDYTQFTEFEPKTEFVKEYICVKDYHPIITTKNGKRPTEKAIIKKGIILTFDSTINAYRHESDALYEYILKDYKDCFQPFRGHFSSK